MLCSPGIVRVVGWAGRKRGGDERYTENFSGEKMKETDCLEDLGVVVRTMLKCIVYK
jgi:hypothetical protein